MQVTPKHADRDNRFHNALQQVLEQSKTLNGELGSITLREYRTQGVTHTHASATVKHRIFVTVKADEE